MASPDLQWLIIRNNSSFLLKGNGQTYSREPNNLKSLNSFRYNGLVHKKTVGVVPAKDGKGVVLITKKTNAGKRPGKGYSKVELKRGSRQTFSSIRKTLRSNRYRKDLKMAAVRRASALLKSQKPVVVKKSGLKSK
ncbi:large ribosomal subunit protein eL28-like [Crassostrea virginica]